MNRSSSQAVTSSIYLSEIFSGIQGEGHYVGHRQIFVRLSGCNIRCVYCDQPEALELHNTTCRIEQVPGKRDWEIAPSPYLISQLIRKVVSLNEQVPHHSVTLTGGEPLMQADKLSELVGGLKENNFRIHLETNAMLARSLGKCAQYLDAISMDIKLDSVDRQAIPIEKHVNFARKALELNPGVHLYLKVVVGPDTSASELCDAISKLSPIEEITDIYLQPVTPFGLVTTTISPRDLLALQDRALAVTPLVRVLPQVHKFIDQL